MKRTLNNISHDDDADSLRESVSALADGRLRGREFECAVARTLDDVQATATWHSYHVIGDVLRFGETAGFSADNGFAARFAARLAQEGIPARSWVEPPLSATENIADKDQSTSASDLRHHENRPREAANSPNFRWKAVAGLATFVAVGAIGWIALGIAVETGTSAQIVRAPAPAINAPPQAVAGLAGQSTLPSAAPAVARSEPQQMIRDPRLDELLAAHEQAGGMSALQMPAGFFRNATFEGRGR